MILQQEVVVIHLTREWWKGIVFIYLFGPYLDRITFCTGRSYELGHDFHLACIAPSKHKLKRSQPK